MAAAAVSSASPGTAAGRRGAGLFHDFLRIVTRALVELPGAAQVGHVERAQGEARREGEAEERECPAVQREFHPVSLETFNAQNRRSVTWRDGYNSTRVSPPERAPIPILDLTRYDADLKRDVARAVEGVFASGRFVLGPANDAFEKALAATLGARHAVGVSSGTDALLVALMALDVGPGDEVVTSPFSFFASAGVVARLNARPVFVDIEPEAFNMNPSLLEAAITPRTKAIQPVHLYGQCADMSPILEIAARRGIPVLEDACQAIGATYDGRAAGTLGAMGAYSSIRPRTSARPEMRAPWRPPMTRRRPC